MKRAPLRAEVSGAAALTLAALLAALYWWTGIGPLGGAAIGLAVLGALLGRPSRG